MKYEVYKVEDRATSTGKKMKSLVLQREGAQYPIKNVALWENHPLFETIVSGQEIDVEIVEKDSDKENPHKPGTFYKNRSVAMPGMAPTQVKGEVTRAEFDDLKRRVFACESHLKPDTSAQQQTNESEDLADQDIPF